LRARRSDPASWKSHLQQGLGPLALLILDRSLLAVDSAGNMPLDPAWVRSCLVPWSRDSISGFRSAVAVLVRAGVFASYVAEGRDFGHLMGFVEQGGSKVVEWPAWPLAEGGAIALAAAASKLVAERCAVVSRATARLSAYEGVKGVGTGERLTDLTSPSGTDLVLDTGPGDSGLRSSGVGSARARARAKRLLSWSASECGVPGPVVLAVERRCPWLLELPWWSWASLAPVWLAWHGVKVLGRRGGPPLDWRAFGVAAFPAWLDEHREPAKRGVLLGLLTKSNRAPAPGR